MGGMKSISSVFIPDLSTSALKPYSFCQTSSIIFCTLASLVEELTCLEKKMVKYYFSMVWATLYLHENTQEEFNIIISKSLISLGLAITMCLDHNNLVDVCVWSYPRHLSKRHWRKP